MGFWNEQKVLVGVGGGIAAYRTLDLVRALRLAGAEVRVAPTPAALQFVTPLSLQALASGPVHAELFSLVEEQEMGHIRLAREPHLIIVAPATADLLARMAGGHGDDLLTTLLLAREGPVLVAPAMNRAMWQHPATRRNVATLQQDGIHFIGPDEGPLACGEVGPGRMAGVMDILEQARRILTPKTLAGRRLLITAGPTREALDPVRFISNHSSGRMGVAVALAVLRAGGEVVMVHGPMEQAIPLGARCRPVVSAREMWTACQEEWSGCDAAVLTAAVGDFAPVVAHDSKVKKETLSDGQWHLTLTQTPDILATLAAHRRPEQVVVGFAAETGDLLTKARDKLQRKGCDLLVANDLSQPGSGFGVSTNQVTLVWRDGREEAWPLLAKDDVGDRLTAVIAGLIKP